MFEFKKPLPKTAEEFEVFSDRIFDQFQIPESDSLKGTLATMIMHLGPTDDEAFDSYFGAALRKQLSNNVAYAKIQEINEKLKAEAQAKQTEADLKASDESVPIAPI